MDRDTFNEMQAILAEQIDVLRVSDFDKLWHRFTEPRRGLLHRKVRPTAKMDEVSEVRGPSGRSYEIEISSSVEHDKDLHVFVSVIDSDQPELSVEDDIVVKRDS